MLNHLVHRRILEHGKEVFQGAVESILCELCARVSDGELGSPDMRILPPLGFTEDTEKPSANWNGPSLRGRQILEV